MGSNPTPRTPSSTHRIGSRYILEIESQALSEILSFGFWMQKAGYRSSTVKTCIRSLKAVARRTKLFDPESVKGHLATARVLEPPLTAICAYDTRVSKEGKGGLHLDLIKAHKAVIIADPTGGVASSY